MNYCEKWWGWGDLSQSFPKDSTQKILNLLPSQWLQKEVDASIPLAITKKIEEIELPGIRLSNQDITHFKEIVGEKNFCTDKKTRLCHSFGKSYVDLIQARDKKIRFSPDAVIFPEDERHVHEIIAYAHFQNICVTPFGGGTSVLGGVNPQGTEPYQPVLTLSLRHLDKILKIDAASRMADVQVGILGPDLEKQLNSHGFTLGHFPQSFEFSTLGGWIATRSAGHSSNHYGRIEDLVLSLKVATPQGILETKPHPASSCGPNWNEVYLGSEGSFGVITQASLSLSEIPECKEYLSFLLPSYQEGLNVLRAIKKNYLSPSIVRLSDPHETQFMIALSDDQPCSKSSRAFLKNAWRSFPRTFPKNIYLSFGQKLKKISQQQASLLILCLEGSINEVSTLKSKIKTLCKKGLSLGKSVGIKWEKNYFLSPYLRDELIHRGVLLDTLETVTSWTYFEKLYLETHKALKNSLGQDAIVLCHISHIYPTGASLYFTFLAQAHDNPITQWIRMKNDVTQVIMNNHGALSHHHGVGQDHKKWIYDEKGPLVMDQMKALKKFIDPKNILNPNKLL
ncbi:MAG: FAD-binding oxidoreductase [Deltaproteobacteria bacterium]|nr:FAD-binding oxidoreductase [Deltaproteobacteria bacterium]